VIKTRRIRWAGYEAHMGERRGVYMVLVWKHGGKRPLGRARCRWEDNITMDLPEMGWERGLGWIGLIWLRVGTGGMLL